MEHYQLSLDSSAAMDTVDMCSPLVPSQYSTWKTSDDCIVLPSNNFEMDVDNVIFTCLFGEDIENDIKLQHLTRSKEAVLFDDTGLSLKQKEIELDLAPLVPSNSSDISGKDFSSTLEEYVWKPIEDSLLRECKDEIIGACDPGFSSSSSKMKNSRKTKGNKQKCASFEECRSVCKEETLKLKITGECASESLEPQENKFLKQPLSTSVQKRKQTPEEKRELKKQRAHVWRQRKRNDEEQKNMLIENLRAKLKALERERDTRDFKADLEKKDRVIGELRTSNEALKRELEALKLKLDKAEESRKSQLGKSSECDVFDFLNEYNPEVFEKNRPVTKVDMIKLFSAFIDAGGNKRVFHQLVDS